MKSSKDIRVEGGATYFIMLEVKLKNNTNNIESILFGDKGLMIGTLYLHQGKSKIEKKLFLKQGFKHLLFKGETIDKKVVKKDIVEVKVNQIII